MRCTEFHGQLSFVVLRFTGKPDFEIVDEYRVMKAKLKVMVS